MNVTTLVTKTRLEIREPLESQSSVTDEQIRDDLQEAYDDIVEKVRPLQGLLRLRNTPESVAATVGGTFLSTDVLNWQTGDVVQITANPPGNFALSTDYYYIEEGVPSDGVTFSLAATRDDAYEGTAITIGAVGGTVTVEGAIGMIRNFGNDKMLDVLHALYDSGSATSFPMQYVTQLDIDELQRYVTSRPYYYTITDGKMLFYPYLGTNERVRVRYDRYGYSLFLPADPSDVKSDGEVETPEFSDKYHNLLYLYAAARVFTREGNQKAAINMMGLYARGVDEMGDSHLKNASKRPVVIRRPRRWRV